MHIVGQDSGPTRRTRNTPAARSSDSSCDRASRDGERRLPCLKQEAAGCLASTSPRIELVALGVKLRSCECARVDHRVEQRVREIKKEKKRETRWSDFFISW